MAHMMTVYKTDNRVLHEVEEMDPGVWIMMTNPTMEESQEVAEKYDIDMVDVRAALDEEESSRIELEDGYTLILVDIRRWRSVMNPRTIPQSRWVSF